MVTYAIPVKYTGPIRKALSNPLWPKLDRGSSSEMSLESSDFTSKSKSVDKPITTAVTLSIYCGNSSKWMTG